MIARHKTFIICLLCGINIFAYGQTPITTASLLKEMISYRSVAQWPQPFYTEAQASSYDRKSISPNQPGWFANADASQYIGTETVSGHPEHVMMDVDGPGAIVRFWLTTFKRAGTIRIYFDGNTEPEITIPAYDLMQSGLPLGKALLTPHSSYEAKQKGGSTLYLPMPYAKHCKITFEDKDPDNQPRYYQINYRTYPVGTMVETFTLKTLATLSALTADVNDKLLHPDSVVNGRTLKSNKNIQAKKQISAQLLQASSAIKLISIKIKTDDRKDYEQALRSTILKIEFDGEQTVWCPLGDFAGGGVGARPIQSWYRTTTNDGEMISRWVMPYRKSARISILNLGDKSVNVSLKVVSDKWKWDNNTMYFHADWKNQVNVPITQCDKDLPATDWDFNTIIGKGIYLGDTFAVYNHMHKWYGEGDQKVWINGQSFPAEYGTGTEDYYNASWAPVVLYQTPFANAPRADNGDSFGNNTFTRTRNLDRVPFNRSFRFSLETLGWENGTSDFAATTYWYGFKGAKSSVAAHQTLPTKLN
jgi:hypothetical protein